MRQRGGVQNKPILCRKNWVRRRNPARDWRRRSLYQQAWRQPQPRKERKNAYHGGERRRELAYGSAGHAEQCWRVNIKRTWRPVGVMVRWVANKRLLAFSLHHLARQIVTCVARKERIGKISTSLGNM